MSALTNSEYIKMKDYFTHRHDGDEMLRYNLEKGGPSNIRHGLIVGFNKNYEIEHGMEILSKCGDVYQRLANDPKVTKEQLVILELNIAEITAKLAEKAKGDQDEEIQMIFKKVTQTISTCKKDENAKHNESAMKCPQKVDLSLYNRHQKEFCYRLLYPEHRGEPSEDAQNECFDALIHGELRLPENIEDVQNQLKAMAQQAEVQEINKEVLLREGIGSEEDYQNRLDPTIENPPSYQDIISGRVSLSRFQASVGRNLFYASCEKEMNEFLESLEQQGFSLNPEKVDQVKKRTLEIGMGYFEFLKKTSSDNLGFLKENSAISRKDFESKVTNPKASSSLYDDFILGSREVSYWQSGNGPLFQKPSRPSSGSASYASSSASGKRGLSPKEIEAEKLRGKALQLLDVQKGNPSSYDILHVNITADQSDVKKAYYKYAKQYHPDKIDKDDPESKAKEEAFKLVSIAYTEICEQKHWI